MKPDGIYFINFFRLSKPYYLAKISIYRAIIKGKAYEKNKSLQID